MDVNNKGKIIKGGRAISIFLVLLFMIVALGGAIASAPAITNITSSTADGVYGVGAIIDVNITFDQNVNLIGPGLPVLKLSSGADANGIYFDGNARDNNQLCFKYTIAAGQTSLDLNATSIDLNGGGISNTAHGANYTSTTISVPDANSLKTNKNIKIDTTAPTVTNVTTATANGRHFVGEVIDVNVTFSETVTVTG
ncbi:MAG: hypothetical protein NTY48_04875, partial [Candidatus Diapherotrites archaeon]|nr:hypothetical protein [Candidatus Diapherotrites archaeon]